MIVPPLGSRLPIAYAGTAVLSTWHPCDNNPRNSPPALPFGQIDFGEHSLGVVASELRDQPSLRIEKQHVDFRIRGKERLRSVGHALVVARGNRRLQVRVRRHQMRREFEIGDVVREFFVKGLVRVFDTIVDFLKQLMLREPREHGQHRQHQKDRHRHKGGEFCARFLVETWRHVITASAKLSSALQPARRLAVDHRKKRGDHGPSFGLP